ncbi:MAG: hypothetical protein WCD04_05490 [Terriglobia bacterium]
MSSVIVGTASWLAVSDAKASARQSTRTAKDAMADQYRPATEPISLFEKKEELRRILKSRHFANAPKKSRFLEFVCEQTLLGNGEKLNEYLIGVEVYGRGSDFNPQEDPIVRVQAHEMRRSLKSYYDEEGKTSPLRIDLPLGHYVPVFSKAAMEETTTPVAQEAQVAAAPRRREQFYYALILGLAATCAILAFLLIRERSRTEQAARSPLRLPEELEWFWEPFLPPADPPIIVIPNHPLLRAAHDGDSAQTLAHGHEIAKDELPEFRDTIHFRELKRFVFVSTTTDFTGVGETMGLSNLFGLFSQTGQKPRLVQSRLVTFEEIKHGNAILLGGNQAWSGRVFLNPEGFRFQAGVILNKNPRPGEKPLYKPEFDPVTDHLTLDYALVLMLPNERKENRILLVYGIYTQGSQAAIEYLTSAERLPELHKALVALSPDRKTPPPYFQFLLETTVENYVPGKASLVAVRVVSN